MEHIRRTAIENLQKRVSDTYKETTESCSCENKNISRGCYRSMSSDIEDSIALFLSKLLPDTYYFLLDTSICVNGKINRPDLLILNEKKQVIAMIEIKAHMGWCRSNAEILKVLEKIKLYNDKFKEAHELEYSIKVNSDKQKATYSENVKLFLIAFTGDNCPDKNHNNHKELAKEKCIKHYILFSGWYNELKCKDIYEFIKDISQCN